MKKENKKKISSNQSLHLDILGHRNPQRARQQDRAALKLKKQKHDNRRHCEREILGNLYTLNQGRKMCVNNTGYPDYVEVILQERDTYRIR